MKTIIAANWKMHKTASEAKAFIDAFIPLVEGLEAYIAAPFTSLYNVVGSKGLKIGAQNMSEHREGAFTGEISVSMLKELGVQFVVLGHSERRHVFGETDAMIAAKVALAIEEGMPIILCVGEKIEERKGGLMKEVLKRQLSTALQNITIPDGYELVIAYEPVWAIGTGEAATPEMADEAHLYCREVLSDLIGKNRAQSTTILYGGSVKPQNAKELIEKEQINGFLVGGASLEPQSFATIVKESL